MTFVSVPQAARHLGVAESTIWNWIKKGWIPTVPVGQTQHIPIDALNEVFVPNYVPERHSA